MNGSPGNEAATKDSDEVSLKFEPKFMDSLDARVMQYKYALVKLERLIEAVDDSLKAVNDSPDTIILIHYLIYLASNLFAIHEPGFLPKLKALENFKLIKSASVVVSQVVTHIPYDMRDLETVPFDDLPSSASSVSCLKAFRALCLTCQDAYQKRYLNASKEIANDEYLQDLDSLFTKSFFDVEKDFDLVLSSGLFEKSCLMFRVNTQTSFCDDYSEASLIDIDLCSLFTITEETSKMLNRQKPMIEKYKTIKQAPKNLQDKQLKDTIYNAYALHRVFFWALRVNELYFILRKFGRQIFVSNHDHLHDQKFGSFVSKSHHYREMLKDIDENFFNTKKNGVLIATITRFLRMDSNQEITPKSIFEFVGFVFQSVTYIEGLLSVLKEFGNTWISAELAFRTSHNLPVDYLLKINDIVESEKVQDLKAKRQRAQILAKQKAKQNVSSNVKTPTNRQVIPVIKAPIKLPAASSSPASSIDSKKSVSSLELGSKLRTGSLTSKPSGAQSPLFLQRQSSATSLQANSSTTSLTEKASTTPTGRRRSSSQPISYNAAATALKGNTGPVPVKQEYFTRSPSGSIKRSGLMTKKPSQTLIASPASNKRPVMDVVEEHKEISQPKAEVKKSASQKFQQHLLEASRSGALYSKEKEVFNNVVFDPNNPSATNLRRQSKVSVASNRKENSVSSLKENPNAPQALVDQKPTRAQITKINTRRNSVVMQSNNPSRASDISRNSMISTLSQTSSAMESVVIKKVRFTGVPEYTPAEDAPETQTSRILKSFAALKIPAVKSTTVKRKDEEFKQEESQLFKQYITHGDPKALQTYNGIYAPGSQISLKFARFKNRF
ncbi:hypothetical protein METBIDRAFT_42638 [Metschnikowia bicuspidata var. bicuspidata NRRL YB-4993]|uniref:Uncharacterized protein n=1 Tax=Metschnikowia bicuspidata var. bicuspidata NRRL YB-4993 TaxID=869754 RepID=A0A1A0HCK4_9ASCO|nr:hypothetical protein METBIDRAFT_42638 [Metschnikowia bicuspidata var. bicuspidata NRRL YB-4993]OBA21725.1 hypothetical protein METBIDRAFT_42638 [Metschnikowia bicuspidata var. bicuspidata NRRL YB-4993]